MKRCPHCATVFENREWTCPECAFSPAFTAGFPAFAPELSGGGAGFKPEVYAELAALEADNFWFRA